MKHYISSHITVSEIFNGWTFMLTPAIFIKRSDRYNIVERYRSKLRDFGCEL